MSGVKRVGGLHINFAGMSHKEACHDCKQAPATVHYVLGAKRCQACSDAFDLANREHKAAEEAARIAAHVCDESDDVCEECCEHEEHDHGYCMDCGADRMDALVGAAEDAWEGDR